MGLENLSEGWPHTKVVQGYQCLKCLRIYEKFCKCPYCKVTVKPIVPQIDE